MRCIIDERTLVWGQRRFIEGGVGGQPAQSVLQDQNTIDMLPLLTYFVHNAVCRPPNFAY